MTTQTSSCSFRIEIASLTQVSFHSSLIYRGNQNLKVILSLLEIMSWNLNHSRRVSQGTKKPRIVRFKHQYLLRQNKSKRTIFSGTLKSLSTAADRMKKAKSLSFSRLIKILKFWALKDKSKRQAEQSPPIGRFPMKAKIIILRVP